MENPLAKSKPKTRLSKRAVSQPEPLFTQQSLIIGAVVIVVVVVIGLVLFFVNKNRQPSASPVAANSQYNTPDSTADTTGGNSMNTQSPCIGVSDPTDVQVPPNGNQQRWDHPDQVTDYTHRYCAIFTTEHGRF